MQKARDEAAHGRRCVALIGMTLYRFFPDYLVKGKTLCKYYRQYYPVDKGDVIAVLRKLSGMFDNVNQKVGEIAGEVGMTPSVWNGGVFSMIRNLSETVIIPIAGIILTFVMCYELIQMVIEKNNMHDFETFMFFKWIFKTFVAVMIITNTFNIIMGIFDLSQHVVLRCSSVIIRYQ